MPISDETQHLGFPLGIQEQIADISKIGEALRLRYKVDDLTRPDTKDDEDTVWVDVKETLEELHQDRLVFVPMVPLSIKILLGLLALWFLVSCAGIVLWMIRGGS